MVVSATSTCGRYKHLMPIKAMALSWNVFYVPHMHNFGTSIGDYKVIINFGERLPSRWYALAKIK